MDIHTHCASEQKTPGHRAAQPKLALGKKHLHIFFLSNYGGEFSHLDYTAFSITVIWKQMVTLLYLKILFCAQLMLYCSLLRHPRPHTIGWIYCRCVWYKFNIYIHVRNSAFDFANSLNRAAVSKVSTFAWNLIFYYLKQWHDWYILDIPTITHIYSLFYTQDSYMKTCLFSAVLF